MSLVDCVIPAHNEEDYLKGAIQSAMQLTAPDQVVVVENRSTDDTYATAQETDARVLREARPGPSKTKNRGYKATNAEWVLFLDADSRLDNPPATRSYLQSATGDVLTLPLKPIKDTYRNKAVIAYKNANNAIRNVFGLAYGNGQATIIQRDAAEQIRDQYGDLFNEDLLTREDSDLIRRAQQVGLDHQRPDVYVNTSMRLYENEGHLNRVVQELMEKYDGPKRPRWNIPETPHMKSS
jgi:glycosyltransferase involved in cell wall biosynthesis